MFNEVLLEVDPGNPVQDFDQAPGLFELPPETTLVVVIQSCPDI